MGEKTKLLRWGDVKNRLAKHGIKEHELRQAIKNNAVVPVRFRDGARAYYNWSEVMNAFNLKDS